MDTPTTEIEAITLVRQIRDDHYQQLQGKTHAERIAFYHEQAQKMAQKIALLSSTEEDGSQTANVTSVAMVG